SRWSPLRPCRSRLAVHQARTEPELAEPPLARAAQCRVLAARAQGVVVAADPAESRPVRGAWEAAAWGPAVVALAVWAGVAVRAVRAARAQGVVVAADPAESRAVRGAWEAAAWGPAVVALGGWAGVAGRAG